MHYIITYTLRNDKHLLYKEHTRFIENINNSYTLLQTVWPPNSADADNHTPGRFLLSVFLPAIESSQSPLSSTILSDSYPDLYYFI